MWTKFSCRPRGQNKNSSPIRHNVDAMIIMNTLGWNHLKDVYRVNVLQNRRDCDLSSITNLNFRYFPQPINNQFLLLITHTSFAICLSSILTKLMPALSASSSICSISARTLGHCLQSSLSVGWGNKMCNSSF